MKSKKQKRESGWKEEVSFENTDGSREAMLYRFIKQLQKYRYRTLICYGEEYGTMEKKYDTKPITFELLFTMEKIWFCGKKIVIG